MPPVPPEPPAPPEPLDDRTAIRRGFAFLSLASALVTGLFLFNTFRSPRMWWVAIMPVVVTAGLYVTLLVVCFRQRTHASGSPFILRRWLPVVLGLAALAVTVAALFGRRDRLALGALGVFALFGVLGGPFWPERSEPDEVG